MMPFCSLLCFPPMLIYLWEVWNNPIVTNYYSSVSDLVLPVYCWRNYILKRSKNVQNSSGGSGETSNCGDGWQKSKPYCAEMTGGDPSLYNHILILHSKKDYIAYTLLDIARSFVAKFWNFWFCGHVGVIVQALILWHTRWAWEVLF